VSPRVRVLLPSLLLLFGLLTGCGGDDEPEPATGPGLPSQVDLRSYFEAITSSDPDQISKAASEVAADGSLAQGYATYVSEVAVAAAAAGTPIDPADVDEVDGGFKACAGEDQCVTWTDLEGKGGKLADFTVNGTGLDDLLVDLTGQPPIESAGLYKVQPEWAYRLPLSGTLNVVVTITASDVPLSAKAGIYIENDKILKGREPAGPSVIKAGASSPVVLPFPKAQDAKLDGQVTFGLRLGDDQGSESIGFGLTPPAP
jgi:hypothetical protein